MVLVPFLLRLDLLLYLSLALLYLGLQLPLLLPAPTVDLLSHFLDVVPEFVDQELKLLSVLVLGCCDCGFSRSEVINQIASVSKLSFFLLHPSSFAAKQEHMGH